MPSDDSNPYVAPQTDLAPAAAPAPARGPARGSSTDPKGLWRRGRELIAERKCVFPDRCVKCDAPADGRRITRYLSWHPPGLFFLLFLGILLYVIVAALVRKQQTIRFGLCAEHARLRKRSITISLLLVGLGLPLIGGGVYATQQNSILGIVLWLGIALLFVAPFYFASTNQSLTAKHIDEARARLRGAGTPFLESLPCLDNRQAERHKVP